MQVRRFLCFLALLLMMTVSCMAQKLAGVVVDKSTGDSIPMASAIYKGHNVMVCATIDGRFNILRHNGWVLSISALGYETQNITITNQTPNHITVKLKPTSNQLENVVIAAKKKKYSRKNNPAVELMKRVIAAKRQTNLENYDYYQLTKYQKLALSLNDYKKKDSDSVSVKKKKKSLWQGQAEISQYNGKWTLPVSVDETVTQRFYRKDPQKTRDLIQGEQSSGINQLIVTGEMVNTTLKDVFQDVDIYKEYVRLVQFPFLSPIADGAISFYRYYIVDTVKVEKDSCYHLQFLPNNQQDFGFRGDLWVVKDSSLHIKKCDLSIPKKSDVNYVRNLHITQTFSQVPVNSDNPKDSAKVEWVLTKDEMWAEMTILKKPFLVVRSTTLSDYSFNLLPKTVFKGAGTVVRSPMARSRDDDFWNQYRAVALTEKESAVSSFMDKLKNSKGAKIPLFCIKIFFENYVETGRKGKPSKFDFGPFMSTFSSNFVDGFRMRLSGRTTPFLDRHWALRGFVTYGFRSEKVYYEGEVAYHLNKKRKTFIEFPVRSISFEQSYDIESPADRYLSSSKDNIFVNIKTESVQQLYIHNRQTLKFTYETDWCLYMNTHLRTESITPMGNDTKGDNSDPFSFTTPGPLGTKLLGTVADYYRNTEWNVDIKYAPGQTLINTKQMRIPINRDAPEYSFKHTIGVLNYLGGAHISNQTEFGIYKRQWLGSWGRVDMHLRAAFQWNKVPFPSLLTPEICLSYIEQPGTFNMLHNLEFFADRKVSFSAVWNMNGKIFNRIPLLKKLKLREFIGFRAVWGYLTDKNNPAKNPNDDVLFVFPGGSKAMDGGVPYMEATVGIHNIFKFFCVDYVRRLNYLDDKTAANGVRFGLEFTF